jgi:hypothetical protein
MSREKSKVEYAVERIIDRIEKILFEGDASPDKELLPFLEGALLEGYNALYGLGVSIEGISGMKSLA